MWMQEPNPSIRVSAKRNPGKDESDECGPNGYTSLADIYKAPIPARDHRRRTLTVHTQRVGDSYVGGLIMYVFAQGELVWSGFLPHSIVAGLDGPIGVRSDSGNYSFKLEREPHR